MLEKITVDTPAGEIQARAVHGDDYPCIALVFNGPGAGEPGAVMEYDEKERCVVLRVWSKERPEDDQVAIYRMTDPIPQKGDDC